jgi:predicted lysophospholipase L1 biosynthesis ABC-type transport system permease subunit
MRGLIQDIRYGLRVLAKSPGFAAVAVITLALGIGANTTVFSFLHGMLLKPLSYPDEDRLVFVCGAKPSAGWERSTISIPDYIDYREQSRSFVHMGVYARLLAVFAAIALLIAAVGLYGVMAYSVSQRAHEIGIRMALGAQARHVLRLVVTRSAITALIGVAVGIGLALALGNALQAIMYGVSPNDPATYLGVGLVMLLVALLAGFLPARRATRVDPMVALRCE